MTINGGMIIWCKNKNKIATREIENFFFVFQELDFTQKEKKVWN